jgi:site-specific recombinase XerD
VHRYFALLRSPPEHWLRPRKLHKDEALQMTQLLINGLSDKSLQYTQTVLGQLFSYLQHAQYVQGNPFKLSTRFSIVDHQVTEKSLDVKTWRYLWQWVCQRQCEQPSNLISVRSRWLLALLYHTGLRREEVAKAKMSDCILGDYGWELKVLGKGRKLRRITLNRHVIEELRLYRQSMGLLPEPHGQENIPLVMSIYKNRLAQSMTPRSIGLLIHQLMQQASMSCQDFLIAQTLMDASTHWLRHTHATHRLAAGASLETTQDELGHSDPKTTRIYAKVLDDQRRRDAEKLAQWNKN